MLNNQKNKQLQELAEEVYKDSRAKKNKQAKFIKHHQTLKEVSQNMTNDPLERLLLASIYKNLGRLGEHEESLQKATQLLPGGPEYETLAIRWKLQLAALRSSRKQHKQCCIMAEQTSRLAVSLLERVKDLSEDDQEKAFIDLILEITRERERDQIVWIHNERSIVGQMLEGIRRKWGEQLSLPYFPEQDFHIADIMSLESHEPRPEEQEKDSHQVWIRDAIIYISISCFTIATEHYYLKDPSHKHQHIRALKIAVATFPAQCSYISFLAKVLSQHFAQSLSSIPEQNGDNHQLRRNLPKDTKEVSLKGLKFAEE